MRTIAVVGNPKVNSRTSEAATRLVRALTGSDPDAVIELSELAQSLLGWGAPAVLSAKASVQAADLVVFASPTFKASFTGLLKLFLDQFEGGTGLRNVLAVPLMLGGGPQHALAPEYTLRPVLTELGAITALPSLYLIDSSFKEDGQIEQYGERHRALVTLLGTQGHRAPSADADAGSSDL